MKSAAFGLFALAATAIATATPASADIQVCAYNNAAVKGRANITFYLTDAEHRWDSGWKTLLAGERYCQRQENVRALNVTVQGLTTEWKKVCDENRRPGESIEVRMTGTVFDLDCKVW